MDILFQIAILIWIFTQKKKYKEKVNEILKENIKEQEVSEIEI